jgi:ABC-2 type transport system ATP-binding protein
VQIVEMRQLIRSLRGEHTILLSSHNLPEISQTCDRLLVIQEGAIVAQETEQQLQERLGGAGGVEIDVVGPSARALEALRKVDGARTAIVVAEGSGVAHLRVEASPDLRPLLVKALVQAEVGVLRVDEPKSGGLEQIFLKLTQQTQRN